MQKLPSKQNLLNSEKNFGLILIWTGFADAKNFSTSVNLMKQKFFFVVVCFFIKKIKFEFSTLLRLIICLFLMMRCHVELPNVYDWKWKTECRIPRSECWKTEHRNILLNFFNLRMLNYNWPNYKSLNSMNKITPIDKYDHPNVYSSITIHVIIASRKESIAFWPVGFLL